MLDVDVDDTLVEVVPAIDTVTMKEAVFVVK
jgi:hypothetical protein